MSDPRPPAEDFVVILPKATRLSDDGKQRLADYLEAAMPGYGFEVMNGGAAGTGLQIIPLNISDDDDIPDSERRSLPEIATVTAIDALIAEFLAGGGRRLN